MMSLSIIPLPQNATQMLQKSNAMTQDSDGHIIVKNNASCPVFLM